MFSNPPAPGNRAVYNVEKYCRDGQAADDNMARVRCILDT